MVVLTTAGLVQVAGILCYLRPRTTPSMPSTMPSTMPSIKLEAIRTQQGKSQINKPVTNPDKSSFYRVDLSLCFF